MEIPLNCGCGSIRGTVSNASLTRGLRLVCYCDDCQLYADHLGAVRVLDPFGGTDIYQTTPAQIRITKGADQIKCLRLSEKGLLRWYSGCCKMPLANTMASPRAPFVGIVHTFMDHSGGSTRDEALGMPRAYTQGKFAVGGVPPHAHPTAPLSIILRFVRGMLLASLRREHTPSPFFDQSGKPVVQPEVLT